VVIVTQKVQQTMEGKHPKFEGVGVPSFACLSPGDAGRNDDITQGRGLNLRGMQEMRWARSVRGVRSDSTDHTPGTSSTSSTLRTKRQDVRRCVLTSIAAVECLDARVGDQGDCNIASRA
jgi:hypothetical protein